tara:strand:+ start:603 stop:857 length:255 start_codon:yes stop_codon:yes gene_type:complete
VDLTSDLGREGFQLFILPFARALSQIDELLFPRKLINSLCSDQNHKNYAFDSNEAVVFATGSSHDEVLLVTYYTTKRSFGLDNF